MTFDQILMTKSKSQASDRPSPPLPYLTVELPGIGGVFKSVPEDFHVEEIPAYEPVGSGEHLLLWIEKRDVSAEQLTGHLSRTLNVPRSDIGMAGMKDRRAITRQYVSVPAKCESALENVNADHIRLLHSARHANKLKTGHLKGNRFSILLREVAENAEGKAEKIAERINAVGFPNYFGEQRFGKDGDTLEWGLALLRGERTERDIPKARRKFLLRLSLSAVQSELFNQVLAKRLADQLMDLVLLGDVMQVVSSGGIFVVEDQSAEEARFLAGETVTTGPLFGPKMRTPGTEVDRMEQAVLDAAGLSREHFRKFSKLTPGGRRAFLVRPMNLEIRPDQEGLRLEFALPSGAYATMLLREFQKTEADG
jgi:tRNA pseudouridine13 synthase